MIKIRLLRGWSVHTPGTELTLGSGQAELLILRGVAEFIEKVDIENDEVQTRHRRNPARTRALRGPLD